MSELHDKARALLALRDGVDEAPWFANGIAIDGAMEIPEFELPTFSRYENVKFAAAAHDMADMIAALLAENERCGEPTAFAPFWPPALRAGERYRVLCDDKGRNGGTWLDVFLANDGDVHVSMQDWENVPDGKPDPWPSLRVRTYTGGGRNERTRQALLWLAEAIRLDTAPRPSLEKKS